MLVRLNCFRGDNGPGDVIELPEAEAAGLLVHGGAHAVEPQKLVADLPQAAKPKAAAKESP